MPHLDEVFLLKLNEIRESLEEYLKDGSAKDYTDYKRVCGEIKGLGVAEREFKDLISRIDED